jgi:hypothetical protein
VRSRAWAARAAALAVLLAGCQSAPPPHNSAVGSATPRVTIVTTETPATAPASEPIGTIAARLAIHGLTALEAAPGGVWYTRSEATQGWVGRATENGVALEKEAGPAPIAIVATASSLYVLEGAPTFSYQGVRTTRLERLDPSSLTVVAASPVPGLPTGLAAAAGEVWVVTAQGGVIGYREGDLAQLDSVQVAGGGDARLAVGDGALLVLTTLVSNGERSALLTRITLPDKAESTARAEAVSALAVSTGGHGVWIATTSNQPGEGQLFPLANDNLGQPLLLPAPVALADDPTGLWWAAQDGRVGLSNGQSAGASSALAAGTGAAAIAISDGFIWVAEDDLVAIRPDATATAHP